MARTATLRRLALRRKFACLVSSGATTSAWSRADSKSSIGYCLVKSSGLLRLGSRGSHTVVRRDAPSVSYVDSRPGIRDGFTETSYHGARAPVGGRTARDYGRISPLSHQQRDFCG